jgi:hypothetical protein
MVDRCVELAGNIAERQRVRVAPSEQQAGRFGQVVGRAPHAPARHPAGAAGVRVLEHSVQQIQHGLLDQETFGRVVAGRGGEQLPLAQIGVGVDAAKGEPDRPALVLRRARIVFIERVADDFFRHRVPIAAVAIGTDRLSPVLLALVVQRHDGRVGGKGRFVLVLDDDRRTREHEAVVANRARVDEVRMVDGTAERADPHRSGFEDDSVGRSSRHRPIILRYGFADGAATSLTMLRLSLRVLRLR